MIRAALLAVAYLCMAFVIADINWLRDIWDWKMEVRAALLWTTGWLVAAGVFIGRGIS